VLIAQRADGLFDVFGRLGRRAVGAARAVLQSCLSFSAVAAKPLVAGGPADLEAAAEQAHVGAFSVGELGEFEAQFHFG